MQEVEFALRLELMDDRSAIVDRPGRVSRNAFWLQVRGGFHGPGDVYAAAKQQACLFRRLVMGGYIDLGPEVLRYVQAFETVCVPPREHVCSRFDMGSIRRSLGNTTEAGQPQA